MLRLSDIKSSVMQVAEAITAALEIETEIIDDHLQIIAGTGRYRSKIGQYEENADLECDLLYSRILRNGEKFICMDCSNDPVYAPQEGELAEISCPILLNDHVVGIIGLIAFTKGQQEKITRRSEKFLDFLSHMAELIASKLVAEEHNRQLRGRLDTFVTSMKTFTSFDDIIGKSKKLAAAKQRALHAASGDSVVLITGESGTGKEVFARAIHCASARSDYPFVSINCGAIPEMLLESELFGYESGAFTGASKEGKPGKFELANKGTIFLDEIGDMPIHMQVKLLHVIQNRYIERIGAVSPIFLDVRIIAATNKNIESMVASGHFREDLYFRLNVIPLIIPSLKEREQDTEILLSYSLKKFSRILHKPVSRFSDEALSTLKSYHWPGNIRELENVVEYAVNMSEGPVIMLKHLPDRLVCNSGTAVNEQNLRFLTDQFHKKIISDCLAQTGHSLSGKQQAAILLGVSQSTLYRRIRELGIEV